MEVMDGVEAEDDESDVVMSGDESLGRIDQEGGVVDGDSVGKGGGSGRSIDESPQPSTSPSVKAVQSRGRMWLTSATQPFVIRRVSKIALNLVGSDGEPLKDKGDEPLDLTGKYYFAMDWKHSHYQVQNKKVEHVMEGSCLNRWIHPPTLDKCL